MNNLYQNVDGQPSSSYRNYIMQIDKMDWRAYDYTKWPCADMSFPDLAEDKDHDLWPYKPDLDRSHWVDLNNQFKSGIKRKGFLNGYTTPDAYVGKDSKKCLAEFELMIKENDLGKIQAAGFKNPDHLRYVAEYTAEAIKKAYADTQAIIDATTAKLDEQMNANISAAKAGGLLDPIHGVTLEDWAAANVRISSGAPLKEILEILCVEKPAWDDLSAEWMARMSRDTTFAISKVYGEAFSNPNIGRFATSQNNTLAANPVIDQVKNDFELYIKIMCHQSMGAVQGIDANAVLKQYGLTAADWGMIGMHWGPQMSTNLELAMKMSSLMEKYNAEFASSAPPKAGSDIDF